MRTIVKLLAVAAILCLTPPAWADPAALAIVEKAIKAHGGAAALKKTQTCTRSDSGALIRADKNVPFTGEVVRSLPDRVKTSIDIDKRLQVVIVFNGTRGWERSTGPAVEMNKTRLEEAREEAHVMWLSTIVPLKKGYALTVLPESKVDGEAVVGVKAVRKGYADSNLYFSKRTGLLLKIARRVPEASILTDKEYIYSGHKAFGGAMLPTREVVTLNGRRFTEVTIREWKFPASIRASTFGRP
jgi:hypothetical protein